MKKIIALCLSMLLVFLSGCTKLPQDTEAAAPTEPTQSPEEEAVMRILNISNSHGQDAVWLLPEVLRTEMPDQQFYVAELYQAYALTEHVQAAQEDAKSHILYTNSDGMWETQKDVSIRMALKSQRWDIIMFNESSRHLGLEEVMSKGLVDWFANYIRENLDYEPVLLYNMTWSNPTDERFYTDTTRQTVPETFKNTYTNSYGFDHVNHYNKLVELTKKYLVDDPAFDRIIWNATPVQYAQDVLGVPQYDENQVYDLYRDYTHLSDFARLMVAYNWYWQMFGVEELTEVKVDLVKWELRASWGGRNKQLGDLAITDAHKQVILDSVNYTLEHPLEMPEV